MELQTKRFNDETIETLTRFIQSGGDSSGIELLDSHKKILDRIRFADEKIRESNGKYKREDIAGFIRGKFEVCRDTAYKDIVMAEAIFSSSYPLNKKYEIQARIELLKKKIWDCYIAKDFFNAAQLEKVLYNYYKIYPDEVPKRSPKNIYYIIQNNNVHVTNLTLEQAAQEAEFLAIELEKKEDY